MYRRAPQHDNISSEQNEGDNSPLKTYQRLPNSEAESTDTAPRKSSPSRSAAKTVIHSPPDEAAGGDKIRQKTLTEPKSRQSLNVLWSWWSELLASLFSILALLAVVAVLLVYNGRNINDLNLPSTLTLNGLIALIATFDRVFLIVPVGSSISQELWLWFAENDGRTKVKSRLRDLNRSDSASRGALGSLVFLLTSPRRFLGLAGAFITILSLAIPFATQQLITQRDIPLLDHGSSLQPGNLPRTEFYTLFSGAPSEGQVSATLDMTAAVYSGLMSSNIEPTQASCPSGNCSWPLTPSIAICGGCAQINPVYSNCNGTGCNYTMPSGTVFELTDLSGGEFAEDGIGFQSMKTYGQHWNTSMNDHVYLANIDMMGLPYGIMGGEINDYVFNYTASECALWICVNTYNTSIKSGQQTENVVSSYSHFSNIGSLQYSTDNLTLRFPDSTFDTGDATYSNYTVAGLAYMGLVEQFTWDNKNTGINGTVQLAQRGSLPSSDTINALWAGTRNQSQWIQNLALSMTNVMRTANQTHRQIYDGTAYVQGVYVVWWWITLPAATVAASTLLLIVVMVRTTRSPVKPWRGSPLTFLFFETDSEIKEAVAKTAPGDKVGPGVSDYPVTLQKSEGVFWALKSHQDDTITIDGLDSGNQ